VGVVSGADQPSISSDRSDYAPDDAVALSGAGWQAGEAVELLVHDDHEPVKAGFLAKGKRGAVARRPSSYPAGSRAVRAGRRGASRIARAGTMTATVAPIATAATPISV